MDSALIENTRIDVRRLWRKACKHEGIDPKSKFVVFSNENPWNDDYNAAMSKYLNLTRPFFA